MARRVSQIRTDAGAGSGVAPPPVLGTSSGERPSLEIMAINILEERGVGTPGLFRVMGNLTTAHSFIKEYERGDDSQLLGCPDPHTIAALLLHLLRTAEPSLLDFQKVLNLELPRDGMASAVISKLRDLFSASPVMDFELAARVCGLLNKVAQSNSTLGPGSVASPPSTTSANAAALSSIVGAAMCRPVGSAYMSIRHKAGLEKIKDVVKALVLHSPSVFAPRPAPSRSRSPSQHTPTPPASPSATLPPPSSPFSLPASASGSPVLRGRRGFSSSPAHSPSRGHAHMGHGPGTSVPLDHQSLNPTTARALDSLLFFAVSGLFSDQSPTASSEEGASAAKEDDSYEPGFTPVPEGAGKTTEDAVVLPATVGWTSQQPITVEPPIPEIKLAPAPKPVHRGNRSVGRSMGPEPTSPIASTILSAAAACTSPPESDADLDGLSTPPQVRSGTGPSKRRSGMAINTILSNETGDEGLSGLAVTVNSPLSAERAHRPRPSASERRAQIQRCKALRSQIRTFESEFEGKHGHQPRGPERTPLRSVYLHYRRLKQGVRDNAATHIQMIYRGFAVRSAMRPSDASGARAGRPSPISADVTSSLTAESVTPPTAPGDISVDTDSKLGESGLTPPSADDDAGDSAAEASGETGSPSAPSASGASASAGIDGDESSHIARRAEEAATSSSAGSISSASKSSLAASTAALREEKAMLKQQLRAFDVEFRLKHGRMPAKSDKEVIRHLYKRYHDVKALLVAMEGAGMEGGAGTGRSAAVPSSFSQSAGSGGGAGLTATAVGDRGEEAAHHINMQASLKTLQREKRALQLFLRKYEDDFFKEHGRKVKYQKDIVPVADDYQRYKEIKLALAYSKPSS